MNSNPDREVVIATGFRKIFGLMFRSRDSPILVFKFKKKIHEPFTAWFVFFPFIMEWYDDNELIDRVTVRPFKTFILPPSGRKFNKVVEIPIIEGEGGDDNGV